MELKHYLRTVIAKWRIVLATFLITFGAVLLLTLNQAPIYRSVSTYVVKANLSEPDARTLAAVLDPLSRAQIQQTVAEVAASQVIKVQAAGVLGLTREQTRDISVDSRVLAGTNVVEIAIEGPNPALTRDFASVVGTNTAGFVQKLYGIYELEILDKPTSPSSPAKPRTLLNLLLGAVAGIVLGVGLAFLSAYLRTAAEGTLPESGPARERTAESIIGVPVGGLETAVTATTVSRARVDGSSVETSPAMEH